MFPPQLSAHLQSPSRATVMGHVDRFVASAGAPQPQLSPAAPAAIDDSQPDAFDLAVAAMSGDERAAPVVDASAEPRRGVAYDMSEPDDFDRAVAAMPLDIDAAPDPPPWGVRR